MAKRAVQELGNDTEPTTTVDVHVAGDEFSEGTAPLAAITAGDDVCPAVRTSGRSRAGSTPSASTVAVAATAVGTPGVGGKRPNSRSPSEPEGLEVLQLVAKGQALSSAVVVVEGVLHKMEEQARYLAVFWEGGLGLEMLCH